MASILVEFERLHNRNLSVLKKLNKFSKENFASPKDYEKFSIVRVQIAASCSNNDRLLRSMFIDEMPWTFCDALNIEGFNFKEYFEVLKRHPEIVSANRKAVYSFLVSLNTQDPARFGMEEFPTMAELEE